MFYDFFCSDPKPDPDPENLTGSGQKVRNRLDPQHLGGQLLIKGEKPLYLPRKSTTGTHTLPFTIFDLVHMQVILSNLLYRWTAVYPNSFYLVRVPVTALPIKRTAITQTAYYPEPGYLSILFSCMCTMLSITIAPSPRDLQEMFRPYSFLPTKSFRGIPFEFCGDRLYVFN